jgi:hypothetical protein
MPENLYSHSARSTTRRGKTRVFPGLLLAGASVIVTCLGAPRSILSQSEHKAQGEGNLLPASIGEPLTVKPLDMQDIDCTVAQWRTTGKMPVLALICPPNTVFSPLRVLIKLSWMKPEDAPVSPEHILAPAGAPTKIRTDKTAALIWLQVDEKGKHEPRGTWIGFNAVVDVALLSGRSK